VRAEVLKQLRTGPARWITLGSLAAGTVVVGIIGGVQGFEVTAVWSLLGWPGGLTLWATLWSLLCFFAPASIAAWGTGVEQSHDTWKTLLVRRGARWPFLVAKLVVALGWLLVLLAGSAVLWLGLAVLLGRVLGPFPALQFDPEPLAQVSAEVLHAVVLLPLIQLVVLRSRSGGTLWGTLAGICFPMAARMLGGSWERFNQFTPLANAKALTLRLADTPLALEAANTLVGTWPPLASALVLVMWFVVPLALTLTFFERKDVLTEAG
jgi:ABC-type transport system involved in multi-copper enzyme maturation permease subunit